MLFPAWVSDMNVLPPFQRLRAIRRVEGALERDAFPRLQMLLLVTLTGAAGFIASYLLLGAGLGAMWLRYLLAMGFAYLAFLLLLWVWLRARIADFAPAPDDLSIPAGDGSAPQRFSGKGGTFDGGGASGNYDDPDSDVALAADAPGVGDAALGAAAEAEEFAIPVVVLVFIAGLFLSSLWVMLSVVTSAPVLFAELLVDGMLSATLYRRLRGIEPRHWLESAFKRTAGPFVFAAVLVAACGWGMSLYAPGARSIGDVILDSRQAR